jgi:hypothetical protein
MNDNDHNSWAMIGFVTRRLNYMDQCDGDYERACGMARRMMSSAQREVLQQLVMTGPVWDGDVASKAARDDLLQAGLASRACVKGEQGYTVANYRGYDVWKAPKPVTFTEL